VLEGTLHFPDVVGAASDIHLGVLGVFH
jgi:hypothetical protein